MSYWWCLIHTTVESDDGEGRRCANSDRLGPYATQDQAASAPEATRARTAAEDARDAADEDW